MASCLFAESTQKYFLSKMKLMNRLLNFEVCLVKRMHFSQRMNFVKSASNSPNDCSLLLSQNRFDSTLVKMHINNTICYNSLLKSNLRVNAIFSCLGFHNVASYNISLLCPIFNRDIILRYYSNINGNNNNKSNFKKISNINRKTTLIKRHEYIRGVLREKQKRIRQTKQQLQRSGKLILADIKESKTKMKERMEEIIERENIWTIPNMLCVTRIAMSPYLGYLIVQTEYQFALALVIFAGITDLLDGVIARSFKTQSSKLGSFLDPMADKVLIATLFLTLTYAGNIPVALTALIVARDLTLVGAGIYIRYTSLPPPKTLSRYLDVSHATAELAPTTISKINTTVQLCTVFTTLAAASFDFQDHPAVLGLWYLTAGTTVASALSYIFSKDTYKILKKKSR